MQGFSFEAQRKGNVFSMIPIVQHHVFIVCFSVLAVAMLLIRLKLRRQSNLARASGAVGLLAVAAITRLAEMVVGIPDNVVEISERLALFSRRHLFRPNDFEIAGAMRRPHNRPPALLFKRKVMLRP